MGTQSEGKCPRLETRITLDSLGVGLALVRIAGESGVLAEPGGIEQREVHRGLPVQDPLGHHAAGHGGVLEAVAAEADGEEETVHTWRGAEDGVVVGRERAQAALMTTGAATSPCVVRTPRALPPATSMAVTSTPSTMPAPSSRARLAKPWVTSAGPARPSWGPHTAAIRSSTCRAGTMAWAS